MASAQWRVRLAVTVGAFAALLAGAEPALAHTGHGAHALWSGLSHPLLGVDHILAMVTVGVLAVVLSRPLAAPATFVGAMTVGGALGMAGLTMPFGQTAIALSVVALGAALVAGTAMRPTAALVLVALAGLVHGHAHGVEAPTAAHPLTYVAGFAAATVALHATGVALGLVTRDARAVRATTGGLVLGAGLGLVVGVL